MRARPRRAPLFEAGDFKKALMLAAIAPAAWFFPPGAWSVLTRTLSAVPVIFDEGAGPLPEEIVSLLGGDRRRALVKLRSQYFEDCMLTLRMWAPWRARVEVEMEGRDEIDKALQQGRGAIIWVAPTAFGSLISKLALQRTGFAVTHLSRASHRFSESRAGMRFLNPVQTRIEDRYLAERLTVNDENSTSTLLALKRRLASKSLVTVAASGASGTVVDLPFMGASFALPAGALRLGAISGAPVLPLIVVHEGGLRFRAVVERPLPIDNQNDSEARYRAAAQVWVAHLEMELRKRPEVWGGWQSWRTTGLQSEPG
jgi:predicted LPLAT superfamily acyltransferase